MPKIVNTALKAKAKAWTFEAKATGPEAKAKAIKFGLEAPRGQGLASRTTSLEFSTSVTHRLLLETSGIAAGLRLRQCWLLYLFTGVIGSASVCQLSPLPSVSCLSEW